MNRMNRSLWLFLGSLLLFAVSMPAATLVVDTSFDLTLFGNRDAGGQQTNFVLTTDRFGNLKNGDGLGVMRNESLVLGGNVVPLSMAGGGYITLVNSGAVITGAKLDLVLNTGSSSVSSALRSGTTLFFTPAFDSLISSLTVKLSSGNVVYTATIPVPPTTFTLDLFAAGFANQIQNGQPISITFTGTETLTADVSGYLPGPTKNGREVLDLSATRNIGSAFGSRITAYYEVPEPFTTALVGAGLLLIGCVRTKFRR